MNEKVEFSTRFRACVVDAGYQARPSLVAREFNLRWHGRSISTQAAWSWLNAKSIPSQDKVQVLAEWLKVEPHKLRFGESVSAQVKLHQQRWAEGISHLEREAIDALLSLPAPQRKLIREIILTFAKVHTESTSPPSV